MAGALAGLAVFALGVVLYARTTGYAFLGWDDRVYVVENPWIRGFSLEHLAAIFGNGLQGGYLPVHLLSYAADYALFGLEPWGYHLHSVLLNALNGALALALVWRLSRRADLALVAALLFTMHHSHVSSVAWVSARKELLFTAFALATALTYLRARREGAFDRGLYAGSVALFTLGMLSKTTIATLPLFLLLADRVEDARLPAEWRRTLGFHLATKLPYLAIAAALVFVNAHTQVVAADPLSGSPLSYVLVKGQAGWRYLWILLGILPGQPIYDPPPISLHPLWAAATLAPLLLPPAALWVALRLGWHQAALALGWLIAGLIPPIAFPLITFMADRYLYAPSLGFTWLLAAALVATADRLVPRPGWRLAALAGVTVFAASWYAARIDYTLPRWRNDETLWRYASQRSRDGRAAVNLAAALAERGRGDEALALLEETEVPGPKGLLQMSLLYAERDRPGEALRAAERALAGIAEPGADPDVVARARVARGVALWKLGREDEARADWERARALDPRSETARRMLERARSGTLP